MGVFYSWMFNLFLSSNSVLEVVVSLLFDFIYILMVEQNGCVCMDQVMVNVDVNFNLIVDVGDLIEVCFGIVIILGGSLIGMFFLVEFGIVIVSYSWSLIIGLSDLMVVNLMFMVIINQMYIVMVIVESGCMVIVFVDVMILDCGVIGDLVWEDDNVNGIQDVGELGIVGVSVQLLNISGMVL